MVHNVREYGAVGDGVADDTAAIQKALDLASAGDGTGGEVLIPSGLYSISKTLTVNVTRGLIIRGEGALALSGKAKSGTRLQWKGEEGGTLFHGTGNCGMVIRDLCFRGDKTGTLIQISRPPGSGDMINRMSNISLHAADTGIQMGEKESDHNCSDYYFDFITFANVNTGFRVKNTQGVDYLFNFIFACNVKENVLEFENGGNLHVNNAQMTGCGRFLEIRGGGRNAGTFLCNGVRVESGCGGRRNRYQLLRCYSRHRLAIVQFNGFDDCQWAWHQNETEDRDKPLCEVGPGTRVVFNSSIFNSPVAHLEGTEKAPASMTLNSCSFSYVKPKDAISTNDFGYYKVSDCMQYIKPIPDIQKWPEFDQSDSSEAKPQTN
ncbi:MAG: glycoside hydrolase family 55 protein [Candidatus Pacebacteria bacterium]|nr:glycoside hydrolase family 55 protein [Candidatus Paceibacterota bacterium]